MNRRHFTELALGTAATALVTGPLRAAVRRSSDLVVDELQWSDDAGANWHADYVHEGASLLFQAVVRNSGTAAIAIPKLIEVEFLVDGEVVEVVGQVAGLGPDDRLTLTGTQLWSAADGSHQVVARVDPGGLVRSEGSEANNTLALTLTVGAAGAAAAIFDNPGDRCEVTTEHRRIAAQKHGLSELPNWRADEKVRMRDRMVKESKFTEAEAEALAALAVDGRLDAAAASTLSPEALATVEATSQLGSLGMALAKVAGFIGASALTGGITPLGFGIVAADQMLGFNLFSSGEVTVNTMIGYSAGTGGSTVGATVMPKPLGTVSNANFPGTTSALAADGAKFWGWSVRFGDGSGNFDTCKMLGTGGKLDRYKGDKKRLGAQFRMYQNAMRRSDSWTLALFNAGFITTGGGATAGGGHMVPTDIGTYGSIYYAECVARGISGGAIYDQPRLDQLYRCCLKLGFRDYALHTGIHGDIHFGPVHHFSSMGIPHSLKASPTNGDGGSPYNRNGLATLFGYSRSMSAQVPNFSTDLMIDLVGTWMKVRSGVQIPAGLVAIVILKTIEFFIRFGWNLTKLTDEMMKFLATRNLTTMPSRDSVARLVTDILLATPGIVAPEVRRWTVNKLLTVMDTTAPNLNVDVKVWQGTGTGGYFTNPAPTVSEYIDVTEIYEKWKLGKISAGRLILYDAGGNIITNQPGL